MPAADPMTLDQLLRRYFWLVLAALTAMAATIGASGVNALVASALGATAKQLSAPPIVTRLPAPPKDGTQRATSAGPILSRNPFDSVTGSLDRVEVEEGPVGGPVDLSDPLNAPACDGVRVLVIAASADPDWSLAALSAGPDSKSTLTRRGSEFNGKEVKYIGWDRVWFTGAGSLCQAKLFVPGEQKTTPAPAPVEAPTTTVRRGGAPPLDPEIAKGIQKLSETEFNIDRGVVDKIIENQAELMRQARIVPEQENGKMVGIRLFGVRPDTLLGVLGMENGDRLEKINGFDMTSPEKALEAYARLRTADKLSVEVTRRGKHMGLDYNIK